MNKISNDVPALVFSHFGVFCHDVAALERSLTQLPAATGKPTAVICHTVKGKGIGFTENNLKWHHKSGLKETEMRELLEALEDE